MKNSSWVKAAGLVSLAALAVAVPAAFHFLSRQSGAPTLHRTSARPGFSLSSRPSGQPRIAQWAGAYGNLPLGFEANIGQSDPRVRYLARGTGYQLFLTNREVVLALGRKDTSNVSRLDRPTGSRAPAPHISVVTMLLDSANPSPEITGVDRLPGKTDYFIGNDPKKWHTDVPSYAGVRYHDVYPGIDLLFYGKRSRLEYDLEVSPGTDPSAIALRFTGARSLRLNSAGNLVAKISGGQVELEKPAAYERVAGVRKPVSVRYALLSGNRVKFAIADYDPRAPLVIDPVVNYATYVGATGDDQATAVAVDPAGDAFICGFTDSINFTNLQSSSGSFDPGPNSSGNYEAFVAELNPTGTALEYFSLLGAGQGTGANSGDRANGIAIDSSDNIYLTGSTFSPNFPVAGNAVQNTPPATILANGTTFVSVINPTISGTLGLAYSTFLGGSASPGGDVGRAIAVDASRFIYVTGKTSVSGLATVGAAQATNNSLSGGNAFLAEINPTPPGTNSLLYYSYIGGSTGDTGFGVAVAPSGGIAYITGQTLDTDLPTKNAFVSTLAANSKGVGFFEVIDTTQSNPAASLLYATYFGSISGTGGGDQANAIALDPNNRAYITGITSSTDFFTTAGAFQATLAGTSNAFLDVFDATKAGTPSLDYASLIGGSNVDGGNGIAVDDSAAAYIAGSTTSPNFPITNGALQPTLPNTTGAGFVAKLNPAGTGSADLVYSSFLGGSTNDNATAITINTSSNGSITTYVAGSTASIDFFPISQTNAHFLATYQGGPHDAFMASLQLIPGVSAQPTALNFQTQLFPPPITYPFQTVTLTNNTHSTASLSSYGVGTASFKAAPDATAGCSQTQTLPAGSSCVIDVFFVPTKSEATTPPTTVNDVLTIDDSLSNSPQQSVALTGLATNSSGVTAISPTTVAFGQVFVATTNGATSTTSTGTTQTVTISNPGNANLTISGVTILPAGTVFTQTNSCGTLPAALAPGAKCTVTVTYTPVSPVTSNATLSINASDSTVPYKIALSGSGVGYALTAPATLTVNAGSSGTLTLTMTPLGGFTGTVALTCTGVPTNASCTISPTSVAASDGITAQSATVTIGASGLLAPRPSKRKPPILPRQFLLLALTAIALSLLLRARRLRTRLGLALATGLFLVLAACGGGAVTAGTYTITLTGTSGTATQSITFSLTVS